jgi:hypothetical protein
MGARRVSLPKSKSVIAGFTRKAGGSYAHTQRDGTKKTRSTVKNMEIKQNKACEGDCPLVPRIPGMRGLLCIGYEGRLRMNESIDLDLKAWERWFKRKREALAVLILAGLGKFFFRG